MSDKKNMADMSEGRVVLLLGVQATVFTLLGLGLWHLTGRPLENFARLSPTDLALGAILGVFFIGIAAATLRLFPRFSRRVMDLQHDTYAFLANSFSDRSVVLVSIFAGVGEEALFRAGLQTIASDYLGAAGGILLSSALFTLLHMSKPAIAVILFAISIIFGVAFWLTGSFVVVATAHVLYDIFAVRYLRDMMQATVTADKAAMVQDET